MTVPPPRRLVRACVRNQQTSFSFRSPQPDSRPARAKEGGVPSGQKGATRTRASASPSLALACFPPPARQVTPRPPQVDASTPLKKEAARAQPWRTHRQGLKDRSSSSRTPTWPPHAAPRLLPPILPTPQAASSPPPTPSQRRHNLPDTRTLRPKTCTERNSSAMTL